MRPWFPVLAAVAVALPGLALRLGAFSAGDPVRALLFGVAIVGAAFLLSWAAEVLQIDVSQGLALALLALIAILPEYVVDATFAWLAAEDPAYAGYAVANMTGANRLLIGLAWPLVIAIVWLRTRRRQVELEPSHGLELVALLAATAYAFILPLKGNISLIDCAVLAAIFAVYVWRLARLPAEEPHLVGPARTIAALPTGQRRGAVGLLGVVAAAIVLLVAKPFATALVATGTAIGVDEFLLVQWLAPLASEAPEFVVVGIFAWRAAGQAALGTVVSSKVNQWMLLVGMLPLVYAVALGGAEPLPLDARQEEEILLTAAQSLFAVALLLDRRLSLSGAGLLFALFGVQFVWPETRVELSVLYVILAAVVLVLSRADLGATFRGAWSSPGQH
ncbi:MAG: sodium:calcium antiporter [Chloroflexota bacterium]|nr:sodium:calcium antiporter [Chloroflexota bacterium]